MTTVIFRQQLVEPDGCDLLELILAARLIGAYWCPINWHYKSDELRHIIDDSQARLLIIDAELWRAMGDATTWALPVVLAGDNGR